MQRALTLAMLLATAAQAHAAGGAALQLVEGGDSVTVVAHGAVAAAEAHVTARGDSLELPLLPGATPARLDSDDAMVKRMEIVGGVAPKLIVRLHHSKKTCERL